jgi:putative peptide zinc metalloprotease protein
MKELQEIKGLKQRLVIDTSEGQTVYFIEVGEIPTYIRLSFYSYYLLEQRSLNISFKVIAETLSQQGKLISTTEVEEAYQTVINQITTITSQKKNQKLTHSGFFFRLPILPKRVVNFLASCLSFAFHKPITYCLIAFISTATAIAPQNDLTISVTSSNFLWGYVLFLASLLMHELGHASACMRYGAKPSEIGFTLYLIWPAFYSDVSAAWQLKRWQRVIVDMGGVFFQLVVAAIYVIIYSFTLWSPLKLALLMIVGSCLLTLNPIFKFDGYWVVSDALGVTNLGQQPSRIIRFFLNKIRKVPTPSLPWPPLVIIILIFYTALSLGVWIYFIWVIIPMFWQTICDYPKLIIHLLNSSSIMEELPSFLSTTLIVLMSLLMLWQLGQMMINIFSYLMKRIPKNETY